MEVLRRVGLGEGARRRGGWTQSLRLGVYGRGVFANYKFDLHKSVKQLFHFLGLFFIFNLLLQLGMLAQLLDCQFVKAGGFLTITFIMYKKIKLMIHILKITDEPVQVTLRSCPFFNDYFV